MWLPEHREFNGLTDPWRKKIQKHDSSRRIPEILLRAERECGSPILIEAGASFIAPLLKEGCIDRLYLTRTDRKGDDHFYHLEEDLGRYHRVKADVVGDERFEIWELIPQK